MAAKQSKSNVLQFPNLRDEVYDQRPQPPREMCSSALSGQLPPFAPDDDFELWARRSLLDEGAPLYNSDHSHLADAKLAFCWTSEAMAVKGRGIAGLTERPQERAVWSSARAVQQLKEWYGCIPDFLLTFYAPVCALLDNASFLALVEHELYHCGQALDEFGCPRFTKDGEVVYTVRGHDVEEFIGVVRRYGAESAAAGVMELVEAAQVDAEVDHALIRQTCGICARKVA